MKKIFLFITAICLAVNWCGSLWAQAPHVLLPDVTSTEGREFFVAWLPNGGSGPKSSDLRLLLIASSRNANTIVVEMPDGSTKTYPVQANGTREITVDPVTIYWDPSKGEEEKAIKKGIRVYSQNSEKFTLYSVNQTGTVGTYSFDGAHILPVEALGTEYMVETAANDETATEFVIMSTKPGQTNVSIELKVNSRVGNTQQLNVTLDGPKQLYIVRSKAPNPDNPADVIDLSGSTICADQTIAVWSGNQQASVPNVDATSKDHAYDQLLPVSKWGTKFIVPMTGLHTQYNEVHITALQDNTALTVTDAVGSKNYTVNSGSNTTVIAEVPFGTTGTLDSKTLYVVANKPVQVYLYSSTGAYNIYQEGTKRHMQGDASMTMIPPLEYLMDTTIFKTYNGGDGGMSHELRIWAKTADANAIRLDGQGIAFSSLFFAPGYSLAKVTLTNGTHTITAPNKSFSGYLYGMNDGQTYLYPVGYDFTPKQDSLFLLDNTQQYPVFRDGQPSPEWKEHYISSTESGWYLDKTLLDNGKYLLDSISICDSTILTFPLKTYLPWGKLIWEIEGAKQGKEYFTPVEQLPGDVTRPVLTHQFHLLPIEKDKTPYEDFEVRGILLRQPVFCDIPEEKWERDTFNTRVHVVRAYNDTTWRIICQGDTVHFFRDTIWINNPATLTEKPVEGVDFTLQRTVYNDTADNIVRGDYKYVKYQLGSTTKSKSYISTGGCDSLSTLKLYVCPTIDETMDVTMCESDLKNLNAQLKDFFNKNNKIDFAASFAARQTDSRWSELGDGSWYFEGTSVLKTTSCISEELYDFMYHGAFYSGCDSTLTLKLRVMPTEVRANKVTVCADPYVWKDENGATIRTISRSDENYNTPCTYTHSIPYTRCVGCPAGGCDSVLYELTLMFVNTDATETVHVCQNAGQVSYTHQDQTWTFDPTGQPTGTPILGGQGYFVADDGCRYSFRCYFYVDPLTTYRDSVVYCYTEGQSVSHTWDGHRYFYYNLKGSSKKETGSVITAQYPTFEQGRLIYELSDTVQAYGDDCDTVYNQVVIIMPDNYDETSKHMADVDTYEWGNKLLAGHKATGYVNPKGLEVVVMTPDRTSYPDNWVVTYDPDIMEYTIVNSTRTVPVRNKDGVAQTCDSTATLLLRIGQQFRDTAYDYSCSSNGTISWRGKRLQIPQGFTSPTEVFFYDSLKTKWPVVGLDSIYVLSLTVFPSFMDTIHDVNECQDIRGYQWYGHMGDGHELYINGQLMDPSWDSIPIINTGHYFITDKMLTLPRDFRHPRLDTLIESNIRCDSIWVLDMTVHEVYDSIYTRVQFSRTLKSNDTLTFFNPKTLFIGDDFDYEAHGGKSRFDLAREVGADKIEIVTGSALYEKKSTSQYGCDSTTYLDISICRMKQNFLSAIIGDNDTTWTFGGDTTPDEYGVKEHTLPLVSCRDINADDNVLPIDYTSDGRPVRSHTYTDTLHTIDGCDSIVHMALQIYPSYQYDTIAYTCHNQPFSWRGMDDLHLLGTDSVTSVVYIPAVYKTAQSGGVVDSVYVLALTIYPGVLQYSTRSLCYNDTIMWHALELYYDPDEHLDELVHIFKDDEYACGREYHMTVEFNPAYGYTGAPDYNNWVDSADVCQFDDFHWYDKNGKEHTANLRDASGRKYTKIPTDRRGWHTIYDSLKTVSCNCDSIYTLHYFVDTAYHFSTDTALCPGEEYQWYVKDMYGNDYTNGKIYSSEFTTHIYDTIHGKTVHGCDSSYYLHVFVDQPYDIYIDTTLCYEDQHFEWNGKVYDDYIIDSHTWREPQEFYDTLWTQTVRAGCDSTMYLHLTIAPSADSLWTDTICIGETYVFYDRVLTAGGVYEKHLTNEWGCDVRYELTLDAFDPTAFDISLDTICINDINVDRTYTIYYTWQGEFQPISYSVRYDSLALEQGFIDQEQIPITEELSPGTEYELYIPLPYMATKEEYPRPDKYYASVAFENGVCESDSLMTYPFEFNINYPNWIMEQRHGDVIALLNENYNGGYTWTQYQWYEGDSALVGQTKPYLHIPTGLTPGAMYHVELIRTGDSIAFPSCEIEAIANPINNDYAPTLGYLSVTPTCVITGHPSIYILSRKDGTYRITAMDGQLVSEGVFRADVTEVQLPALTGMYIVQLWSNDTPEEPYRAIKVFVREQCPDCDTSF